MGVSAQHAQRTGQKMRLGVIAVCKGARLGDFKDMLVDLSSSIRLLLGPKDFWFGGD